MSGVNVFASVYRLANTLHTTCDTGCNSGCFKVSSEILIAFFLLRLCRRYANRFTDSEFFSQLRQKYCSDETVRNCPKK